MTVDELRAALLEFPGDKEVEVLVLTKIQEQGIDWETPIAYSIEDVESNPDGIFINLDD